MKKMLAIIRKDIRLRFAGPSEWLFFLILPIAFTLILAGGTAGAGDARVRLLVVDQANTPLSAELIAALGKSEAIRPQVAPLATAESEFSKRRVSAVLIIPAAFDLPQLRVGNSRARAAPAAQQPERARRLPGRHSRHQPPRQRGGHRGKQCGRGRTHPAVRVGCRAAGLFRRLPGRGANLPGPIARAHRGRCGRGQGSDRIRFQPPVLPPAR